MNSGHLKGPTWDNKKYLMINCLVFSLSLGLVFVVKYLNLTPFLLMLIFSILIFLPGFSLAQLFKINFPKDYFGQIILYLALGFIYNLFLCLLIIIFGLTIDTAVKFYLTTFIIVAVLTLIINFIRPKPKPIDLGSLKKIFQIKNLIYLPLLFLVILVLATVDQLGTNFTGDPLGHLGVIRRVVEGQPITSENLSNVKNQLHIVLTFPVWHVFLGLIAKITNNNIFVIFREIPTTLTLLVFLVWYWFFKRILPNLPVAILALFLFILYYFGPNAYLYTRLAVPDTLCNLLLMPLSFALAIKYIFDKATTYKHLIILSVLLVFMGLIHWTQYFYYLSAMGLFAILYAIFKYRENDFRDTFRKILLSIFANMVLVGPLLIYLKGIIGQNLENFSGVQKGSNNDRFYKFTPYFQLAYVFLPLFGLFFRKYRRLIFLLAIFLVGPLVYNIPGLYEILRRFLSHVFVNRLYSNLGEWPYVIWAIILGFFLILIDRLMTRIETISKHLRYLIDGVLAVAFGWLFFIQYQYETLDVLYERIFSESAKNWLSANYQWLIPAVAIMVLVIFILERHSKKLTDFFSFEENKDQIAALILTLFIILFFSIPAQGHLRTYFGKEINNKHFFSEATDPTLSIINPQKFGGMEAIDFIKNNIPAKSVFDTNTQANYSLPSLVDVHMASYTFDPEPTKKYKDLYNSAVPIEKKLAMLKDGDIDYLIYQYPLGERQSPFDAYPQYFTKIFDRTAAIYQVNI